LHLDDQINPQQKISRLLKGEKLQERVHQQLQEIACDKQLVRSFFKHPSVAYISDA